MAYHRHDQHNERPRFGKQAHDAKPLKATLRVNNPQSDTMSPCLWGRHPFPLHNNGQHDNNSSNRVHTVFCSALRNLQRETTQNMSHRTHIHSATYLEVIQVVRTPIADDDVYEPFDTKDHTNSQFTR